MPTSQAITKHTIIKYKSLCKKYKHEALINADSFNIKSQLLDALMRGMGGGG